MAERGDVLGAAASVAKAAGAEPLSIALGRPAWGVALVADKHTLCLWDGRTVWAQGRNGATRLKPAHIVAAWSLSVCPPS